MALTNTRTAWGGVARTLHWSIAAAILLLVPLGLAAEAWPMRSDAQLAVKTTLFSLHKTLGVAVFFLALLRIGWALSQPRPLPLHPDRRFETRAAEAVHWLLYGALVLVPLSGWVQHAATTGFAPIWWPFGQGLPFVPQDPALAAAAARLHNAFVIILLAALALHVAGALKHHLLDRDATLRRMLSGQAAPPPLAARAPAAARHRPLVPAVAAVAIFAAGAAGALVSMPPGATGTGAAPRAAEASQWQVTEGRLEITVRQMGSPVSGSFSDWQADIAFDPTAVDGRHGEVTVRIDVASLSLGSVTREALGADFLDAGSFPEARFTAAILAPEAADGSAAPEAADGSAAPEAGDGDAPPEATHVAEGRLELAGASVPVRMPFVLEHDGDTAAMTAELRLDRRDFGIGESFAGEDQVGHGVTVSVALSARRSD